MNKNNLNQHTRILGIDPGFGRTGFGIIEKHNAEWKCKAYGCIETPKDILFVERLEVLSRELRYVIKKYKPDYSAVEELFFNTNITTGIKVGHARGVILLTLREERIPVFELTPLQVKQGITGYGRADKKQMQKMIQMQLGLEKIPRPDDAADALAVALTCSARLKQYTQKNT